MQPEIGDTEPVQKAWGVTKATLSVRKERFLYKKDVLSLPPRLAPVSVLVVDCTRDEAYTQIDAGGSTGLWRPSSATGGGGV